MIRLKGIIPQKLQGRFEAWKQERAEKKGKKIVGQSFQRNPDGLSKARIQQRDVKKDRLEESPAKIPSSPESPVSSSDQKLPPYQPENPPPPYQPVDPAVFSQGDTVLSPPYMAKDPDKKDKGIVERGKRKVLGFIGNLALKKDDEGKQRLKDIEKEKERLGKVLKRNYSATSD